MRKTLLFLMLLVTSLTTFAQTIEVDGIKYNVLTFNTLQVAQPSSGHYSGDVVIPAQVTYNNKVYTVTSINTFAFNACPSLKSVTIPNTVTSIPAQAFFQCTKLKNVTIGNGVTSIGTFAFAYCSMLESVIIPNSVTEIGQKAFGRCTGLTSVTIGNGVETLEERLFYGCTNLTNVTIGKSVTWIEADVFIGCTAVKEVKCLAVTPPHVNAVSAEGFGPNVKVLKNSVLDYMRDYYWRRFNILELSEFTITAKPNNSAMGSVTGGGKYLEGEIVSLTATANKGYEFIEWSDTDTANPYIFTASADVNLTAKFHGKTYTLTYKVDGEKYQSFSVECGTALKAIAEPTKDGYTFSGWSGLPATMPAKNVTVTGSFTVNSYTLTYIVDGEVYQTIEVEYGTALKAIAEPTKEGYTFSGWSKLPATMPAKNVTITGTFTKDPDSTPTLSGDYLIKNVATGRFLNGANDWGTKASATLHGQFMTIAEMGEGKYSIDSHISNGGASHFVNQGDNLYVDGAAVGHTFEYLDEGVWAIKDPNGMYLNNQYDNIVNFNATDAADETAQWILLTKEDCDEIMATATENEPQDATWLIKDADFSRNNTYFDEGWSEADKPGKGGDNKNMNAEKWGGNSQEFTTRQTITLPNGWYKLTCDGFYRYNNTTDNTNQVAIDSHADGTEEINSYLFANDEMKALKSIADITTSLALGGDANLPFSQAAASNAFSQGLYDNYLFVEVTDGTLKLGVKKTSHPGCDWTVFDNFELTYYGTAKPEDTIQETFEEQSYILAYRVDGVVTGMDEVYSGSQIEIEEAPTKEGYTFSGWSEAPAIMPEHDVVINGTFTVNSYTLTYIVDGEEYQTAEVEYGTSLKAIAEPTKEGYTFSGWSELPATMPATNVTVTGSFTVNSYSLTYTVDGKEYKTISVEYGTALKAIAEPTKEGYTFSGWSELPPTMPATNVTVTGSFTVNSYTLTYIVDGEVYQTIEVEYDTTLEAIAEPTKEGYTFSGWSELPERMPAEDVTITGTFTEIVIDGINGLNATQDAKFYNMQGVRQQKAQRGVNIIRTADGMIKKVIKL